jgi:hypothetical protein
VLGVIAAYCAEEGAYVFHIPGENYDLIADDIGASGGSAEDDSQSAPETAKGLARSNFFQSPSQSEVRSQSDESSDSGAF